MKVTFDSNVWESIVGPVHKKSSVYKTLHENIRNKTITPYFCEIALSLESIFKVNRLSHSSTYKPKLEIVKEEFDGERFHSVIKFGPDNDAHPGMHSALKTKYHAAVALGFKVLTMTNIGTARAKEILDDEKIKFSTIDDFWAYAERLSECSSYIESIGCGANEYHRLVDKYGIKRTPYEIICHIKSKAEVKRFSASVAEWADGDSISAHYAFGNDYFCTNDKAVNAGSKSIFYPDNLRLLSKKFRVKVIRPDELAYLIVGSR